MSQRRSAAEKKGKENRYAALGFRVDLLIRSSRRYGNILQRVSGGDAREIAGRALLGGGVVSASRTLRDAFAAIFWRNFVLHNFLLVVLAN